jgi:hypothetical protein
MSHRIGLIALLSAAILVSSCASKPPEPQMPPVGTQEHNCLSFWGADAENLLPLLNAQRDAKGLQWARHQQDESTYVALKQLEEALWNALQTEPPTPPPMPPQPPLPGPWDPTKGGTIPQELLDAIKNLAINMEGGGHLSADQLSGAHPPTLGWLNTLVNVGPTPPAVIEKARGIYAALKEALDM